MNTDPTQLSDALLFWKLLGISMLVVTGINGVLQIVGFFKKHPPLEEIIRELELRWEERDKKRIAEQAAAEAAREKELNERLKSYQLKADWEACNHRHEVWTGEVDRRAVYLIKESEERTSKKFEEVRQDYRSLTQTLQTVATDVATLAGRIVKK